MSLSVFTQFMQKIPREYLPRIQKAIDDAAAALGDPKTPDSKYHAIARELDSIRKDIASDSARTTVKALKKHLIKTMIRAGIPAEEAKRRVKSPAESMLRVMEKAEPIRTNTPRLGDTGAVYQYIASLKLAGMATVAVSAWALVISGALVGFNALRSISGVERPKLETSASSSRARFPKYQASQFEMPRPSRVTAIDRRPDTPSPPAPNWNLLLREPRASMNGGSTGEVVWTPSWTPIDRSISPDGGHWAVPK